MPAGAGDESGRGPAVDPDEAAALLAAARQAAGFAHAPYSGLAVGAALLCTDGSVVTGCNVENASYGLSICAERNAAARAVAEGRVGARAVAVACPGGGPCLPCGACRQVLYELWGDVIVVVESRGPGRAWREHRLSELLPEPFGPDALPGLPRRSPGGGEE